MADEEQVFVIGGNDRVVVLGGDSDSPPVVGRDGGPTVTAAEPAVPPFVIGADPQVIVLGGNTDAPLTLSGNDHVVILGGGGGLAGPKGDQGDQGDKGDQGDPGTPGGGGSNGIVTVVSGNLPTANLQIAFRYIDAQTVWAIYRGNDGIDRYQIWQFVDVLP